MGSTYSYNKRINRYNSKRLRISDLISIKCMRNHGSIIIRDDGYCLDQISEKDNIWFYNKSRYLMKTYGITILQYYNICMYNSAISTPVCRYCGRDLHFRELNYGYYPTCRCKDCKSRHRSDGIWLRTDEVRKSRSKSMREYNIKVKWNGKSIEDRRIMVKNWGRKPGKSENPYLTTRNSMVKRIKCMSYRLTDYLLSNVTGIRYDRYKFNRSVDSISKFSMNSFATKGSPEDTCSFYIATTSDNKFKFGVTSKGYGRMSGGHYKNMKILINSNRITISLLEFYVKTNLQSSKEVMEWSNVPEFRRSYIKSIETLGLSKFND